MYVGVGVKLGVTGSVGVGVTAGVRVGVFIGGEGVGECVGVASA